MRIPKEGTNKPASRDDNRLCLCIDRYLQPMESVASLSSQIQRCELEVRAHLVSWRRLQNASPTVTKGRGAMPKELDAERERGVGNQRRVLPTMTLQVASLWSAKLLQCPPGEDRTTLKPSSVCVCVPCLAKGNASAPCSLK